MKKLVLLIFICFLLCGCQSMTSSNSTSNPSYFAEEDNEIINSEEEFVKSMEKVENDIESDITNSINSEEQENSLKSAFITLTDFIFYDGEIKGVKFSDLTDTCKEKILSIYERIDQKIESKYPGYKDSIHDTSIKTYSNIKEKVIDLKDKILSQYQEKVGDENYQNTMDDFQEDKKRIEEVYDEYKPYIEEGKSKAKDTYSKVKDKVSSWYREYKES